MRSKRSKETKHCLVESGSQSRKKIDGKITTYPFSLKCSINTRKVPLDVTIVSGLQFEIKI